MKPVIIIALAFVLFIPITVFAQNTTLDNSTLLVENQSYENELNNEKIAMNNNLEKIIDQQTQSKGLAKLGIILAIIGIITSSGAFIFAYKGDKEIQNLLHKLGLNIKNILSSSRVKIETGEVTKTPISIKGPKNLDNSFKEKMTLLINKLPEEKLSSSLHQGKLIALELKDKEMEEWIQDELDGYQSVTGNKKKEKELQKNPPENRMITGHFFIGSTLPDVRPAKITRRVFINQPIAYVEDVVEKHNAGKIRTTLPYPIKDTGTEMDGTTMDLLLPGEEWSSVLIKTRQKLSKFLESHLFKK